VGQTDAAVSNRAPVTGMLYCMGKCRESAGPRLLCGVLLEWSFALSSAMSLTEYLLQSLIQLSTFRFYDSFVYKMIGQIMINRIILRLAYSDIHILLIISPLPVTIISSIEHRKY
jgi:hypothetical protein